jgi:hypothetical protein
MVVVAIGGSASVGKSTLAMQLSRHLSVDRVVHVDDFRGPSFIDSTPNVWSRPADWLHDALIVETEQVHAVIATEIEALLAASATGLIEGEGVEPRLAHRWAPELVRPVYVIEDDTRRLHETFARRQPARFLALSRAEQDAVVEMNRGYGAWLRAEAESRSQPWVPSQPWPTLAERALAAIGMPTRSTRAG